MPLPISPWAPRRLDLAAQMIGLEAHLLETRTGCGPLTRRYLLHPSYEHNALTPVLIVLHDGGESAEQGQIFTRWWFDDLAQRTSAVLVYANGGPIMGPGANSWVNGGVWQTDAAAHPAVDDVAYLDALLADLRAQHGLARGDVFLAGVGSGAHMALVAALQRDDQYAGVAAFLPQRAPLEGELASLATPGARRLRSVFIAVPQALDENPSRLAMEWAAALGGAPGPVHVTRQKPLVRRIDSKLGGGVELRIMTLPSGVDPFPGPGGADPLAHAASAKRPQFFDGPGAAWDFFQRARQ